MQSPTLPSIPETAAHESEMAGRKAVNEGMDRNKPSKPMYTRTRRHSLPVMSLISLVSQSPVGTGHPVRTSDSGSLVSAPLVSISSFSDSDEQCGIPRRKRSISMSSTFDAGNNDTSQNSQAQPSFTDCAGEFDSVVSSATLESVDQHLNEEKRFVQNSSRSLNLTSKQAVVMPMIPTSEENTNHCEVLEMPQQVHIPKLVAKYAGIWKTKTAEHRSSTDDNLLDNLARHSVTSRHMRSPTLLSTPETAAYESEMTDTFHEDSHKNRLTQRCLRKWRAITKSHVGTHTTQNITSKPQSELTLSKHTKRRKAVSEDLDRNKSTKSMYTHTRRHSLPFMSPTSLVSQNLVDTGHPVKDFR